MDNYELKAHLKTLELTDKQIEIYIYLTQNGHLSSTQISKGVNIPKTTVYRQIENLIQKSLIVREKSERGDIFYVDIYSIKNKLHEKYEQIKQTFSKVNDIENQLEKLKKEQIPTISFKVYEGIEGMKQVVWNTLKSKTTLYFYTNAVRRNIFGDKWFKKYLEEFDLRNIKEKGFEVIRPNEKYPFKEFDVFPNFLKKTEIKFVDEINLSGEITIYNDVYSMFNSINGKYWGFEIHDKNFVAVQKSIFEKLWKTVKYKAYFKNGRYVEQYSKKN